MYTKAALAGLVLGASSALAKDSRTYGISYFWSSPLVEARMDPVITPGKVSSHVHTVVGGDAFSINMGQEDANNAKCTQSRVLGDKSNYWFPPPYHQNSDGTFTKVELDYVKAYYFFEATDDEIKPFPHGFRMISGNPFSRAPVTLPWTENLDPAKGPIQAISFVCPQSGTANAWNSSMSTSAGQGPNFPDQMCNGLYSPLRYNVHFPSCIDENAAIDDYLHNTAWPTSEGSASGKANCPEGFTHVPHLFVEAYWNSMDFTDWTPGQGQQPFVLSQGDPWGYGLHADFVSGWDTDVLNNVISTCNAGGHGDGLDSCPNVQAYSGSPTTCTVASANPSEVVTGTLNALPGCNPLQYGPEDAKVCDCSSGKPVCDGVPAISGGGNSTAPPPGTGGSGSSSASSAAASATSVSENGGSGTGASNPSPTPTDSSTGKSSGDEGDEGDDEDDDTCEPEEPKATPQPETKVRRMHARHLAMHKRGFGEFSF